MYPDKNPLERLKQVPPFLMHALAARANGGGPRKRPALGEIVERSGLTERTYLRTVRKENWGGVKLDVIEGIIRGTGVNPWHMRDHLRYLRNHEFKIPSINKRQQAILDEICAKQGVATEAAELLEA